MRVRHRHRGPEHGHHRRFERPFARFIDFADVKNPVIKKVNVNFEDFNHSLCIVDTKGSHADLTDEYAAIPEEMKRVAEYFGKEVLREVDKN